MKREIHTIKINAINSKLKYMSELVSNQLEAAMIALSENNQNLAEEIMEKDNEIDNLQKEIEEECIKFIATEQPLAKDLRRVFTASKIVTDLERMADLTVDICKIISNNDFKEFIEEANSVWEMEKEIKNMLHLSMEAYLERDTRSAYDICKLDDNIDLYYKEVFKNTLKYVKNNENKITLGTQILFISKYLERIGDHITNICEWIIFSKTGEYVDLNE
ncbi:phosphate transport system regulatory protein PhoU [Clostridium thermobutyricum]|uniref:Phosphate-specific transport system accessory protein PhoU n=1 Tax=Clostridium thermobutyricum TaxID=29372 RepID=N9WDA4_9CLOT|nr:phosphate signaling complex protein PhoU [Clostridium thermobutyricum]ENZ00805.1 phosphate transport system regulatory protein PhoU [Clostridium thermobutyricum]